MAKDSQTNMYEHSVQKIKLLKLYLEKYMNILAMSQHINQCHLYDLFCGPGVHENGGKGSPIIILETIQTLPPNSNLSFSCHFNDLEISKIEMLKEKITEYQLNSTRVKKLEFSTNSYRSLLPNIYKELQKLGPSSKERAFIFIDPYGYRDIRLSDIMALLNNGKTEVLLFLPTQFMFRFERSATPESLKSFITELVPEEDWPKSTTGIEFIERLKVAFKANIGKNFVDSFILTRDRNQFFCLFFFTSHIFGFNKMLEAKWQIDEEEGRGWRLESQETNLFSTVSESTPNTYRLEKSLKRFLASGNKNNLDVYSFTLHEGYLPQHAVAILKELKSEGFIKPVPYPGVKTQKGAYYINYENWKTKQPKIQFKT